MFNSFISRKSAFRCHHSVMRGIASITNPSYILCDSDETAKNCLIPGFDTTQNLNQSRGASHSQFQLAPLEVGLAHTPMLV